MNILKIIDSLADIVGLILLILAIWLLNDIRKNTAGK